MSVDIGRYDEKTGDFANMLVSDDEDFVNIWQKAIDDMGLRFIGGNVTLFKKDINKIKYEFTLVKEYVQNGELREKNKARVSNDIDDILCKLEDFWLPDIPTLDMGRNLHLWGRRKYDSDKDFFDIPADSIIKEAVTKCGKYYIVYMIPGEFLNKVRGNDHVRVNAYYAVKGAKARLCACYDRGLCGTLEEYKGLSMEYIEDQAYGAYMDGAR